ncbi:MAG TPA: hypothetical protein VE075_07780 [Thermoanaerobaculia bacterium]|nr:hypothetical protein [Thermoanaerobaculia bacterium]
MPSEYEPLFAERRAAAADLETVQELFRAAGAPYLRSFWSWLAWALVLPAAALATPPVLARFGPAGTLLTWSAAILLGGAVELAAIRSARAVAAGRPGAEPEAPAPGRSPLATWALRTQGNLSLVALALSSLLLWQDLAWALPGMWLLLLGHSFYLLGGIAFPPFRTYGLLYQLGGVAALWPGGVPLPAFALTTAAANLWMGYTVWREGRGPEAPNQ